MMTTTHNYCFFFFKFDALITGQNFTPLYKKYSKMVLIICRYLTCAILHVVRIMYTVPTYIMGRYTTHQTTNLAAFICIFQENCLLSFIIYIIGRYIDESSRTNIYLYT